MTELSILGVAAAYRRVGYAYLLEGRLMDWRTSDKAARSPEDAAAWAQKLINDLEPQVVVTEKQETAKKKSDRTKAVIGAVARTASHNYLLDVSIEHRRSHANKYEEAAELAQRYPEIAGWLPKKRRFFDNEPRNIVLFEALALADDVRSGPTTTLAAAMG